MKTGETSTTGTDAILVVSAHAADFVWRAGGVIAAASERGEAVLVVCLSYGERGESARAWRDGKTLDEVKALRRDEAEQAAEVLDVGIEFLDLGDYPLRCTDETLAELVGIYRRFRPTTVLTHTLSDPYNYDHPLAANMALESRILAQAAGYPAEGEPLGAPSVFHFEPHQPEQCGFRPDVLVDITPVFERKEKAMACMGAQSHLAAYYTDLARRRGMQLQRNAGPNLGFPAETYAEAYQRLYPQVTDVLS